MPTVHEHFSEQFQKWEVRGRGWQLFDHPIYPEPPFAPCQYRSMTEPPLADAGRSHTFLSSLMERWSQQLSLPAERPELPEVADASAEPTPALWDRDSLVELQMSLPDDFNPGRDAITQFFHGLSLCREPVAFELVGNHHRVVAQFAVGEDDLALVRRQLQAAFPEVQFTERRTTLPANWNTSSGNEAFAVEFGLKEEFMLPLAVSKLDPFVAIVAALAELQAGELALFQVLWQPVQNLWAEAITQSVTTADGKPLFVNAPELAVAAERKISFPLHAVVVRILARTSQRRRLYEIARELASALHGFSHPHGNALIPLENDEYPHIEHLEDVLCRRSRRTGMILNSEELAGFVHLPSNAVRSPALLRDAGQTKAVPDFLRQPTDFVLGDNENNGDSVSVYLTPDQRVRHTHIIGASGTGKSSLLFNLIRQDIENGEGVGVLDPHGDLINQLLGIIPDDRIDDVVLVDPSDVEFPIGFNILSAHSEAEKELLASDLIAMFRRLATSWGDQMDTVLQNAILAFLNSRQGGTLSDLRLFLLDTKGTRFQKQFLATVTDPEVVFFWRNVFPELTGNKSIGPVLTRLQDFFSRKPLRNMVGQLQNKLDFADIMDHGKIFLARLPEGCGAENSYLLGTLLVSKFQQLAMARQSQPAAARRDFWLYIDEFDHFITPSMAEILKGARKYRLGLTLAHQELHQLQEDAKVASAVLTQPCTRIVLKVGDDDAKKLAEGFESFAAKSLKNLPKYQAIVRVERNDADFNLVLRKPEFPEAAEAQTQRDKAIAASRNKYATPREAVETELLTRIWGLKPPAPTADNAEDAPSPKPSPPLPKSIAVPTPEVVLPPDPLAPALQPMVTAEPPAPAADKESQPVIKPAGMDVRTPPSLVAKPTVADKPSPKGLGRGMAWHQSVQKRIKTAGQKYGFAAESEKQLAKGSMQAADIVLRRGHVGIAVEIASDGSTINHEFENIQKCLNAGFSRVAAVASGRKFLEKLAAAAAGALEPEAAAKVSYQTPDEFIDELRQLAATSELPPAAKPLTEKEVCGDFEIERTFPQQSTEEIKTTQHGIHAVVTEALRRSPTPGKS